MQPVDSKLCLRHQLRLVPEARPAPAFEIPYNNAFMPRVAWEMRLGYKLNSEQYELMPIYLLLPPRIFTLHGFYRLP